MIIIKAANSEYRVRKTDFKVASFNLFVVNFYKYLVDYINLIKILVRISELYLFLFFSKIKKYKYELKLYIDLITLVKI